MSLFSLATIVLVASQTARDARPVTCAEAHAVFQRIEAAMAKAAHSKPPVIRLAGGPKAVTRVQVVVELDQLSKAFASQYTLKPRTQYCNEGAIKLPVGEKAGAVRLIKLGFVEPVAPLAVGPKDTLTVVQFAEALGFFVERWADMTHLPSIKWSPALMPDAVMPTPPFGSRGRAPSGASRPPTSK